MDVMPCCLVDDYQLFTLLYLPSDWFTRCPATDEAASPTAEHGSNTHSGTEPPPGSR